MRILYEIFKINRDIKKLYNKGWKVGWYSPNMVEFFNYTKLFEFSKDKFEGRTLDQAIRIQQMTEDTGSFDGLLELVKSNEEPIALERWK